MGKIKFFRLLLLIFICFQSDLVFCQNDSTSTELNIQKCLELALERNFEIKQLIINEQIEQNNLDQSKYQYLPQFSASWNYQMNWGTTFNTVSFQRNTTQTGFSSPRISLNQNIFSGFMVKSTIHENIYRVFAAKERTAKRKNDILTQVAFSYMQVIFDKSNITIQKNKISVLENQKERINKLLNAGSTTYAELGNINSQIATEKLTLVNFQNQLERDKLSIIQLIQSPVNGNYIFIEPDTSKIILGAKSLPGLDDLIAYATENMPQIKEQKMNLKSSEWAVKRIYGQYYPTVSLFGNLSSQYTTQKSPFMGDRTNYLEQLDDNFQKSLVLQVQIPIFSNFKVRTSYQNARLNVKLNQINIDLAKNTLIQEIQKAYLDVTLADSKLKSIREQISTLQLALNVAEKQYNAGALSFYSYNEALNNLIRTQFEAIQSRYDYLFKLKILDIYQGKELTF